MEDNIQSLQDGLVIMKNMIPLSIQQQVIDEILEFGEGMDENQPGKKKIDMDLRQRSMITVSKDQFMDGNMVNYILELTEKAREKDKTLPTFQPNLAKMNYYPSNGFIGWHADTIPNLSKDLHKTVESPVVSLSLGNSALFLYKNNLEEQPKEILLESGDVLIFGGPSRMIYHSVPKIIPNSTPKEINMGKFRKGRFNILYREKIEVPEDQKWDESDGYTMRDLMAGRNL